MVEEHFTSTLSSNIVTNPQSPVLTHDVESEGNLSNITKNVSIDISLNPGVIENINVGHNSSPSDLKYYMALFK